MKQVIRQVRSLHGEVAVPGDKSITHRAILFSALANGTSRIQGMLDAADPRSSLRCIQDLGVETHISNDSLIIKGKGKYGLRTPHRILDAGNSGTTLRLMTGILSGQNFSSEITGDDSLCSRPMRRVIEPLRQMGARIESTAGFNAPLKILESNGLTGISYELKIASAQVKSAVILAGMYASGTTRIIESIPTRDHTERMLGLKIIRQPSKTTIEINNEFVLPATDYQIPGDPSSAAFLVSAGILAKNSEILVKNVCLNPSRTAYIEIFRSIGGEISVGNRRVIAGESIGDITVSSSSLHGDITLEGSIIPSIIDEIPILTTTAAFSNGKFMLHDAQELRKKESDRISSVVHNLRKMGIEVEEYDDGFAFMPKNHLIPSEFESFGDHRIAMAFGIAGMFMDGESSVNNSECVDISFPTFWSIIHQLSA